MPGYLRDYVLDWLGQQCFLECRGVPELVSLNPFSFTIKAGFAEGRTMNRVEQLIPSLAAENKAFIDQSGAESARRH